MYDVRKELADLVDQAKVLHSNEYHLSLESVVLIGKLDCRNASNNLCMSSRQFAKFIGLTSNQYWKRLQAARLVRFFPIALEMVKAGELHVSHLVLLAARATQANSDILFAGVKNKSKREVENFLSRLTCEGFLLQKEPTEELVLKVNTAELNMLNRVREILTVDGYVPSPSQVVVKVLSDFLDYSGRETEMESLQCHSLGSKSGSDSNSL